MPPASEAVPLSPDGAAVALSPEGAAVNSQGRTPTAFRILSLPNSLLSTILIVS
jgi:hypothetical protein